MQKLNLESLQGLGNRGKLLKILMTYKQKSDYYWNTLLFLGNIIMKGSEKLSLFVEKGPLDE